MSCTQCDKEPVRGAYYRWKNANVEIIACSIHWREITEALNAVQEKSEKIKEKMKWAKSILKKAPK